MTETFYWDLNDKTRAFTARVRPTMPANSPPTMVQAGCYSAALHYLKTVKEMGVAAAKASGAATVARMKAMPVVDDAFGDTSIRADGRRITPAYLFEVKEPGESRAPYDYYKLLQTTPAAEAFRPMNAGGCALVHL
jgi:branched-chain amino acid transport system substrate-binding protein